MGITGTEVSKEAAVMILTDDNFATIVKAVELGRALYDNLMRYIRFQMASLFGFIATFLGASIFNILGGVPFLPLQTLWINFTVTVFLAIGLGYSKPRAASWTTRRGPRMSRSCRAPLALWLVFVGLVFAVADARPDRVGRATGTARPSPTRWALVDVLAVPRLLLAGDRRTRTGRSSAASCSRTRRC